MKFEIDAKELLKCLDRAFGAINTGKKTDAALNCYTIEVKSSGQLRVYGTDLEGDVFGKGVKTAGVPLAILGALPLAFLYGAHVRQRASAGEKPGPVDRFVEQHPVLATSIMVGLARFGSKLSGSGEFSRLLEKAVAKLP